MRSNNLLIIACLIALAATTSAQTPSSSLAPAPQKRGTTQGNPHARLNYVPNKPVKVWAIPIAQSVMARYPDYRKAYYKDYSYVHGYMFEAMFRLGDYTSDAGYQSYIKRYMDQFVDEDGNYTGDKLTYLDNFMTASAFCSLYYRTKDERYKKAALQVLKAVEGYPQSDGQFWHNSSKPNMWIDGVFMMQMFLIRCGEYVGQTDYCYNIACRNIIAAARHLLRPDGLVLHAWTTRPENTIWADKQTGLSPEVWSEGMGWYTLVVPELLAVLPKTHPDYRKVSDIYTAMMKGLKQYQDKKTGGWYFIVDKGSGPQNFIDPSGTAMFVYSIQRGIDLGLLSKAEYGPLAKAGYKSLLSHFVVNDQGLVDVTGACDGVGVQKDFEDYVALPKSLNAKEAVGGALWATVIMEKKQLKKYGTLLDNYFY